MGEQAPEQLSGAELLQNAFSQEGTDSNTSSPVVDAPAPTPVAEPIQTGNPSWQSILNAVPDVLHEKLRPELEAWDKGVQKKFEEYQQKYEPFKEFESIDPGVLRAGTQLYNTLNSDPVRLFNSLQEYFQQNNIPIPGMQQQPGTVDLGEEVTDEELDDPRLVELQNNQTKILQALQAREQEETDRQAEIWMTTQQTRVTNELKAKNIEPDWEYILGVAGGLTQAGMDPTKAMDAARDKYATMVAKFQPASDSAPLLMPPSGSGTPATPAFNPATLDTKGRKNYATQMLSQAFRDV